MQKVKCENADSPTDEMSIREHIAADKMRIKIAPIVLI